MTSDESRAVAFLGVLLCLALVARFMNRPKPVTINAGAVDIEALRAAGKSLAQQPPRSKSRRKTQASDTSTANLRVSTKVWTEPAWRRSGAATTSDTSEERGDPLNVNRATAAEIELLPGIGPAVAKRIIARRDSVRRFEKLEDLDAVKGIGPALLKKIEPFVTFH